MRILFLGKRHYTNQDTLSQRFGRIYRLPLSWHRAGHEVHLVLLDYHGTSRLVSGKDGFAAQSLPAFDPRSVAHLSAAMKAIQPEIVVASGDCFTGLLGHWLTRGTDTRFVFDVYDDYRTFGAYRLFIGWDALGFLCGRADMVTYASRAMADGHDFDNPAVVVPNGVDDSTFTPASLSEARARLRLPATGELVGYFGSMTPEHGVSVLLQALEKLAPRRPDLRLLLCGKQHPSTPITGERVLYRGMVPHEMIPGYLNASNVLALPYLHGDFLDNASSCKIAEYLFCQRPIVATRTPNFLQNFPDQARELDPVVVLPGDVEALSAAIERQLEDPLIAEPPGDMTWQAIAERLIAHFRQL